MLKRGTLTVMKVLRKSQGLNQAALGKKCYPNIAQNVISVIENCTYEPWPEQLHAIAIALSFPLNPELLLMGFQQFKEEYDTSMLTSLQEPEEIKITRDVNYKHRKYGE